MNEQAHLLKVNQTPLPGTRRLMFCGDTITLTLSLSSPVRGRAWVRTNLGTARITGKEIIDQVEKDLIPLGKSWFDHEMISKNDHTFYIRLPLHQTGFFQAKCFFIPEKETDPVWPEGENVTLSIEPPGTCCANIIYNAFVRQFKQSEKKNFKNGHFENNVHVKPPDTTKDEKPRTGTDKDLQTNGHGGASDTTDENQGIDKMIQALDQKGYTVIPESGKFRNLINQVEFIFSELGCRVLHLLPIHPTPTTYARMGRFGSPYAALNFTDVDPALAQFDPKVTPLEQFMELVDKVHYYGGYLFMDIAINHTGWAASLHETHPEWLVRDAEGRIEAPGAWGVVWEDLTKLDYTKKELWQYMADIFLLWCRRGVDGFRCDAGYMIPVAAWEYMVAKVRNVFPDTLFFLEGLGGAMEITCDILTRANFNWAYSELFQTHTKDELTRYLPRAWEISHTCGHLIHFAETHDNNRLAAVSPTHAKMKTAMAALFSVCGGFGFANGVEWFATEKINVHDAPSLNWGNHENQVAHIARLTRILKTHPCFFAQTQITLIEQENPHGVVLCRYHPANYHSAKAKKDEKILYVLVNLDCQSRQRLTFSSARSQQSPTYDTGPSQQMIGSLNGAQTDPQHHGEWYDLVSGKKMAATTTQTSSQEIFITLNLAPGEVVALTPHEEDITLLEQDRAKERRAPNQVTMQKYKAKLLSLLTHIRGFGHLNLESMGVKATMDRNGAMLSSEAMDIETEALAFAQDPIEYIRALNPDSQESRVIPYEIPGDIRRQVMIPPGFFLLVRAEVRFRAYIMGLPNRGHAKFSETEHLKHPEPCNDWAYQIKSTQCLEYVEGVPTPDNSGFFALISPFDIEKETGKNSDKTHRELQLHLRIFAPDKTRVETGQLLALAPMEKLNMGSIFSRLEMRDSPRLKLLSTTKTGGMMRALADFGTLESRYDGFLGANLNPHFPENRQMIWARCRAWAVFQGYSRSLTHECLGRFRFSYTHGGTWRFFIPTSEGSAYVLDLYLNLDRSSNRVTLSVKREYANKKNPTFIEENKEKGTFLADERPITLILRPDMENRDFHQTVKAFTGPETQWPEAITASEKGFIFDLSKDHLMANKKDETSQGEQMGPINPQAILTVTRGEFIHEPEWHYMVHRPLEATRGLDAASDLFSPGYFTATLKGGESTQLTGAVIDSGHPPPAPLPLPDPESFKERVNFAEAIYQSLDAFIVDRDDDKSVIAGFPWFLDWGRDSLIFCRSLIELGRRDEALAILKTFGRFEQNGTLPNMICGKDARNIETSDAPLWFFACCRDLVNTSSGIYNGTTHPLDPSEKNIADQPGKEFKYRTDTHLEEVPIKDKIDVLNVSAGRRTSEDESRTLKEILLSMGSALVKGTPTGVKSDPETGLIYSPSHFTWMDTNFPAGSPREGYPVEIQALWYNALTLLADIDPAGGWKGMSETVKNSIIQYFWQEELGYFSDCLHSDSGPHPSVDPSAVKTAKRDDALRPNQLLLITLGVITEKRLAQKTVENCLELLVPGGIRSLADRPLSHPLFIERDGKLLRDPHAPYSGTYQGDEDTMRKPAYHNGTAWTWQFPLFCEAWAIAFGEKSRETSLAWLGSVSRLMRSGAAGYIPEILDGDFPHTPRGCDAQAWGSSEAARVIHKLRNGFSTRQV